jgi:Fe2+ or Zn2+ uptake regulation protein
VTAGGTNAGSAAPQTTQNLAESASASSPQLVHRAGIRPASHRYARRVVAVPPSAAVFERLRASGVRLTAARRAVVEALVSGDDHLTADELADRVAAAAPDVHLSTVYRTLDALERAGVATHVHLGHGRAVYHLTDQPHHHAVCDACGHVVELADDVLGDVQRRLRREIGFEIDAHHFALVGRCRGCRDAGGT